MPNIKSQKKRVITSRKDKMRNKAVRSSLRHHLKKANATIADSDNKTEIVSNAFSAIDVAARKGVIHKNNANRKKAQIAKKAAQ